MGAFRETRENGRGVGAPVTCGVLREILRAGLLEFDFRGFGFFPGEGDGAVVGNGGFKGFPVGEIDGSCLREAPAKE